MQMPPRCFALARPRPQQCCCRLALYLLLQAGLATQQSEEQPD